MSSKQPLAPRLRARIIRHAAVLFLLGLLVGLVFTFEMIGHIEIWPVLPKLSVSLPGDVGGWHRAHLGFIVNAIAMLAFAVAGAHVSFGDGAGRWYARAVIVTGWGNSIAFLIAAVYGVHGLEFGSGVANTATYLLFLVAALAAFLQSGLLIVAAGHAARS